MKEIIFCFLLVFVSQICEAQVVDGPKVLTHNNYYLSDNSWWRCDNDTKKGCLGGPLNLLGLNPDEEKFVRSTLNAIPFFPKKTTNAEISRIIGKSPVMNLDGRFQSYAFKHDSSYWTINIGFRDGSVINMKWEIVGKFLLVKARVDCGESGKCS